MSRRYRRDRLGRFAASPGIRVVSALDEADDALQRAEAGVREIEQARRAQTRARRRSVARHAVAGAAVGALVPAPAVAKVTAARSVAFASASTAAGAKIGQRVGRARLGRRSAAGVKVRR
ncbi:hypothetical protein VZC37_01445 [Gordonia sp. LSe1-13]|uniref:Uncharacterized protein n=1 Tax=Gordonia sesuvii TaxID=3116777 RepID=A0ABU7M829_9ACTN|nr:hypothetical protein [Gordonia sp. LSe1-13]